MRDDRLCDDPIYFCLDNTLKIYRVIMEKSPGDSIFQDAITNLRRAKAQRTQELKTGTILPSGYCNHEPNAEEPE